MSTVAPAPRPARRRPARPAAPAKAPARRPRPAARARRRRALLNGAVLWVVLLAGLFAGIVALNVTALRGTLEANRIDGRVQQLEAQNAALAHDVASQSGYWQIMARAKKRE